MNTQASWSGTLSHVATNLYRSFGYTTTQDRADALHGAVLRLLSLQNTSGLGLSDEDLRRWLHCVASRMLLDARRMQLRTTLFSDLSIATDTHAEEEPPEYLFYESEYEGIDICYALQRLSPSLRTCFELHSQGFHAEEIALTLGLHREAVHKRIQRARIEMQRNLKEYL